MPRVIALDWDDAELRGILASPLGDSAQIEQIFSIPLPVAGTTEEKQSAISFAAGQILGSVGKGKIVVALGRGAGELRKLSLPPAPPAEVPDLVRFQAMRDFNEIVEDAPLDYIPLVSSETEQQLVFAGTIPPGALKQIQAVTAESLGELAHVTVRSVGISALLGSIAPGAEGDLTLAICAGKHDLELVCLDRERIAFLRSARLAHEEGVSALDAVLWELRRTLLAVQSQLAPQKVGQIVILGQADALTGLEEAIREQGTIPCRTLDPLAALPRLSAAALPNQTSSFAPLVGLATDAVHGVAPQLDFLHPRKKPEPISPLKKYGPWAAIAAGVLLIISAPAVYGKYRDEALLADLDQQIAEKEPLAKTAEDTSKKLDELSKWNEVDINWLDEIAELSDELPKADQLMLTHLQGATHDTNGTLDMDGVVLDGDVFFDMLANLNDERHFIDSPDYSPSSKQKDYSVSFNKGHLVIKPKGQKGPAAAAAKEASRATP